MVYDGDEYDDIDDEDGDNDSDKEIGLIIALISYNVTYFEFQH